MLNETYLKRFGEYMDWTKTGFGLWCLTPLSTIFHLYRESVLLVEETGVPRENHRPVASHWQTLSHNVVSSTPRHELKQDYLNLLNIYITKTLMASVRLLHLCSIYQLVSYAHQWRHDSDFKMKNSNISAFSYLLTKLDIISSFFL